MGGPNVIKRVKDGGRSIRIIDRSEDTALLALRIEGGTTNQGMKPAFRSWKRQGNGFSLCLQKECRTADTLILDQ